VDLVLKLLNKDKKERLGAANDAEEILKHPFFASLNLDEVLAGTMTPPLKMSFDSSGAVDTRFFNSRSAPQDLQETVLPQAN